MCGVNPRRRGVGSALSGRSLSQAWNRARGSPSVGRAAIGSALLASARGTGYRRIAAQLDRPLSTVRRWIRAVRDPAHVEWLRTQAVGWLARVDRDVLGGLRPEATRLGEALTALTAAAVTLRAPGRAPRAGVDADRADYPRPAPRQARPGRAGLRSGSCRVLARPQPGATATTPTPPARARTAAP